jgi:ribosomal protein S18 acetylase RimI-like enzyme
MAEAKHACYSRMTYLPPIPSIAEHRRWIGEGLLPNQEVWIAEDGEGTFLGWASLSSGELNHIYVRPEFQSRGIGGAMLAHVMERMPDGFVLWTFQKNEGARRFYERHGFRVVKLTDGRANMEQEPDVQYEWRPDA